MASANQVIEMNTVPDRGRKPSAAHGTRQVHVLFLIDELCGKGGAELALLNTVCSLPKRFRCSVVTFRLNPNLPLLREFPCPVKLMPLGRTFDWNAMVMAARLSWYIRHERVDVVHTFFASADLWGGIVAKLSRRPLISSRRDMGFQRARKHRIAYRALRGMFDHVLAVSDAVRGYAISEDGLDPARVQTIPNAVSLKKLEVRESVAQLRHRFNLTEASHVISSVGNIRHIKGTDILVRTAGLVCRQFPKAAFVVAGALETAEAGYVRELEGMKRDLHIVRNVRFLGKLEDVAPILKASDVYCMLSRSEGFSNALLEAMASGLPCVTTRVGGNAEALMDGRCGFLVDNEDYKAAASCVCKLLGSPSLAKGIGNLAFRSVCAHFSSEIVTTELVNVYDRILQGRRQPKLPTA